MIRKIKRWFWWHFKACRHDKAFQDALIHGFSISQYDGTKDIRIDSKYFLMKGQVKPHGDDLREVTP